jgi:hypothetical protein
MPLSKKGNLILTISLLTLAAIFLMPPITQSTSFHHFADTRSLWGIPNFGNVASNLPFLIIGCYGVVLEALSSVPGAIRATYLVLFLGVLLTGLGSAYYHWHPDNDTLVWD